MDITLQNDKLKVLISPKGAELKSVTKNGRELLWQGDNETWSGTAPVLFPICGGLKDGKFIYKGKEYELEKHGYAKNAEFSPLKISEEKAEFILKSDAETVVKYPFIYELKIVYTLEETRLNVRYEITNCGNDEMYFSIGAHEGYWCPEGIEEYSIIFEEEEFVDSNKVEGTLLSYETENYGKGVKELPLKNSYFEVDALVLQNLKSRSATLKNRQTGKEIKVNYDGFNYLLLWTVPNAKFICIEPWCGLPDFVDSDKDITKKKGIIKVSVGETSVKTHSILF